MIILYIFSCSFFILFNQGPNSRIIATGGASTNKTVLQVLSDVFNSPVYTLVRIYLLRLLVFFLYFIIHK